MTRKLGPWGLARLKHEPDGAEAQRRHLETIREMGEAEAGETLRRLALMANVSAHVLTEPLYKATRHLYDFVNDTLSTPQSLDATEMGVDLTLLLDHFFNQLPLARSRMIRTARSFLGDQVAEELGGRFDAEWAKPSAWRTLYEVRNSTQHAILPLLLIELGVQMTEAGQVERSWLLNVDQWRRQHAGFPPVLGRLPGSISFPQLVSELLAFADSQMGYCFLAAGDEFDDAAMEVLELIAEVEATAVDGRPWTPMMVRYDLALPGRNFNQRVLRPDRCGEVLMNTDLARERAGRRRKRPLAPDDADQAELGPAFRPHRA